MQQNAWQPSHGYQVGDRITHRFRRHWLAIWWDRLTSMRWDVDLTEPRSFICTSTSAGSIWPEAMDVANIDLRPVHLPAGAVIDAKRD